MDSNSRRHPTLLEYLIEEDFLPQSEGAWFDHETSGHLVRVVYEPDDECQVIALAPRGVCLYKAMFSPGTPPAVIIAVIEAALAEPPETDRPQQSQGRNPGTASPAASSGRRKAGRDDDR